MVVQYSIFLGFGLSVYSFIGGQYIKSPAVNSLSGTRKQLISGFFAPTVIFLGSLYAAVTARFVLVCLFDKEHKHVTSHTVKGWLTRISLLGTFSNRLHQLPRLACIKVR